MPVANPYAGREQTRAKHFILKRYLEGLAFKVLTFSDLTYVDGFCGPFLSETENCAASGSSFPKLIRMHSDSLPQPSRHFTNLTTDSRFKPTTADSKMRSAASMPS
jgi:hypothetical protein